MIELPTRDELRRAWDVIKIAARGLYRTQLPRMAAALAFRTLFSIIPLLVVGLVVIGSFASDEHVEDAVRQVLDFSGLSEIDLKESDDPGATPEAGEEPASVDAWIADLVSRVRSIPFRTLGVMGIIFLVYAAMSLFIEVERAFNQIYHASIGRDWFNKFMTYWFVATLGIVMLVATFFVGQRVVGLVADLAGTSVVGSVLAAGVGFTVTVCISGLLLVSLYKLVPNTSVALRPAGAGALVAAVLWELGKWGFTQYLGATTNYARVYGSVALIPLFMLWVYVTWLIVLFGLQVSYTLQMWRDWEVKPESKDDDRPAVIDPAAIVLVATEAASAFSAGQKLDPAKLAERTGLPDRALRPMIERLAEAGVVHRIVASDDAPSIVTLARPPEAVRLADLIQLGHKLGDLPAGTNGAQVLSQIRSAEIEAAGARTLADLLRPDKPGDRQPG